MDARLGFWHRAIPSVLVVLIICAVLAACSRPPQQPVSSDQSTSAMVRDSDLLQWQGSVTTTTISSSVGATEAAHVVWDKLRRGPALKDRLPPIQRLGGAVAAPLSEVLPSLEVSSVVEVCGLDTVRGSGPAWPHLTHLDRWVVVVQRDEYAALFTIGRKSSGWVYSLHSLSYPEELLPALALMPAERVLIATSDSESTVSWWLLGRDPFGRESLIGLPYSQGDEPQDSSAIWKLGPTMFAKPAP